MDRAVLVILAVGLTVCPLSEHEAERSGREGQPVTLASHAACKVRPITCLGRCSLTATNLSKDANTVILKGRRGASRLAQTVADAVRRRVPI